MEKCKKVLNKQQAIEDKFCETEENGQDISNKKHIAELWIFNNVGKNVAQKLTIERSLTFIILINEYSLLLKPIDIVEVKTPCLLLKMVKLLGMME